MHLRQSIVFVMKTLKGGTSRILGGEFPEPDEFSYALEGMTSYTGDSFWLDSYFAETIGRVNEAVVRDYIRRQQEQRP